MKPGASLEKDLKHCHLSTYNLVLIENHHWLPQWIVLQDINLHQDLSTFPRIQLRLLGDPKRLCHTTALASPPGAFHWDLRRGSVAPHFGRQAWKKELEGCLLRHWLWGKFGDFPTASMGELLNTLPLRFDTDAWKMLWLSQFWCCGPLSWWHDGWVKPYPYRSVFGYENKRTMAVWSFLILASLVVPTKEPMDL